MRVSSESQEDSASKPRARAAHQSIGRARSLYKVKIDVIRQTSISQQICGLYHRDTDISHTSKSIQYDRILDTAFLATRLSLYPPHLNRPRKLRVVYPS
jgi:hypothetical protein